MLVNLEQCLSKEPNIELLQKDKATKSIVVSKIPLKTADKDVYGDIIIHFQKERNGGGEIETVFIPKKGTAVITFDDKNVVGKVLEQSHTFRGEELKVERLVTEHSPVVFQKVEGRVSLNSFHLSRQEAQNMLEILRDKANVRPQDSITGECVLAGTFDQIKATGDVLCDIFKSKDKTTRRGDTTQSKHSFTEAFESEDYSSTNEISYFDVQPQFMKLLEQLYKTELQEIKEKYGVHMVWKSESTQVKIYPTTAEHSGSYQEGSDAFISLYQAFYPKVRRKVIELKFPYDKKVITESDITSMEAANNVAIEMEENKVVIYAEESDISVAVESLRKTLELSRGSSRNPRNNERNSNQNRMSQRSGSSTRVLSQGLENAVTLSLYQGDITEETTHAIVNAANEWLRHGGGVAAAIERKGGRQIEEESRRIISQRNGRPLNVGDAVYTKAGTLPCRFVIHTVGPRWNHFERGKCVALLHRACIQSLNLAAQLRLCSIALPPISSGIFGMPKDICAQVMFEAVEEFSSSVQTQLNTLCDVRIVIIDDETISFFHKEFLNRYTSQETTQTKQARGDKEADSSSDVSSNLDKLPLSSERGKDDYFRSHSKPDEEVKLPPKVQISMGDSNPLEASSTAIESSAEGDQSKLLTPTGVESSNVESRADGIHSEKDSNAPLTTKISKDTSTKPSFGRGRGHIAPLLPLSSERREEDHLKSHSKSDEEVKLPPKVQSGMGDSNPLKHSSTAVESSEEDVQSKLLTPTEVESSKVESRANGIHSEKGSNGPLTTKISKDTRSKPSLGRGRGCLAPSFSKTLGKGEELNSKADTRLIPGHDIVRIGRGITYDSSTLPPGLTMPEEGRRLAQTYSSEPVSEALSKDMKTVSQTIESENQMSPKEKQEPTRTSPEEKVKTKEESPEGRVNPNQEKGSASKMISDDNIPDPNENSNRSNDKSLTGSERPGKAKNTDSYKPEDDYHETEMEVEVDDGERPGKAETTDNYKPEDDQHDTKMEVEDDQSFNDEGPCDIASRQDAMKSDQSSNIGGAREVQERPVIEGPNNREAGRQPNVDEVPPQTSDRGCTMRPNHHEDLVDGLPCGHHYFSEHPNPGERYGECFCSAFLPDNPSGRVVCDLLRRAFDGRLIFTIGKDSATGESNRIVCNGIELKTARTGGPTQFGYPDFSYLDRVIKQLADKGITTLHE
ncbi:uncharacterized protein LOC111330520 isoform X2 [Stylophora pistillata]|uniref:uncharacterized protein LOC111330520 isoform X2 n=1 Tax=Stylophora pistillata TaxID=50429 RepID=UPI000C0504B2|nr:uncharacterized protein LOC111330520 isoform X2 [Stylophora pistillata]